MEDFLFIEHLSHSFHSISGETFVLDDLNFSLKKGEFLAIVGPSGCGKSTLLNLICGLLPCKQGNIVWKHSTDHSPPPMGYMLQRDHLFEWRTIFDNAALGLELQKKPTFLYKKLAEMLSTYGLKDFQTKKPRELSGGMRQRAALIRTLVLQPELLLLDEPFSALDYQTRLQVCDDIYKIIKQEEKTAILITHDISEAISTGDRVMILTKRPTTLHGIFPLDFPDHLTPMERRNHPKFSEYFNLIWKEMQKL